MQGPYADHILDASDVCSNCLRVNRLERVDPVRGGLSRELDSHLERHPRRTTIEFGPHECPPQSKGVFCECGVEGAYERLWDPTDVDEERFKALLKRALRTLEERGVTIKRKETVVYALSHWREYGDVDQALATALEAGLVAAAAGQKAKA